MRARTVEIAVLVRFERAGNLAGEPVGDAVVRTWVVGLDVGRRHHHFGTVCAQHRAFRLAHLVGQHEHGAIPALLCDERESHAGVARRRFHDHAARPELALTFGGADDALSDAVFRRTARIEVLHLHGDLRSHAIGDVVEFDERGVSDEFCNSGVNSHNESLES